MENIIIHISEFIIHIGQRMGVNPRIFASLYVGVTPLCGFTIKRMINQIRTEKPYIIPLIASVIIYFSSEIYVLIAGGTISNRVYIIALGSITFALIKRLSKKATPGKNKFEN